MNKELIESAQAIFDSVEKWNAFMELHSAKDEIRALWFRKFRTKMTEHFYTNDVVPGWSSRGWGDWDMIWHVEKLGEEFMSLWFRDGNRLGFWVNGNQFNVQAVGARLKTPKYAELTSGLRPDESFSNSFIFFETGNFHFNSPFDGSFGATHLSWYAGHEPDELIRQIAEKVNYYRKSEKLTNLLIELYHEEGIKK